MGVLLALALGWLYANTLTGLGREWLSSPDASYGGVLVAVAAAVAWQRRDRAARACTEPPAHSSGGIFVLAAGLVLFLVGELGADGFLARISFAAGLAGTRGFGAGAAVVRVLPAPLAFVLMAVPLRALIVNTVTLP